MGNLKSSCANFSADVRQRGCWSALLFPKKAPEWYAKMVNMGGGGDVHTKPAPEGSMLLLGHITLGVPDLETAETYSIGGLGMGKNLGDSPGELRTTLGPSHIRWRLEPGKEPHLWPGEIRVWVEDIRRTTDMFNMLGRTLGLDLVNEVIGAKTGGEFALKLKCPFRKNWFIATECPYGWAQKLRRIGQAASETDQNGPSDELNALAISDATISVPSKAVMEGVCRFYQHYLLDNMRPPGPSQYSIEVHFGPGDGLHQTLTYMQDPRTPSYANLGSVCVYLHDAQRFHLVYVRCKRGNILKEPETPWEEIEASCEFTIKGCYDPDTHTQVVPLEHVVRHAGHPECPIRLS